MASIYDPDDLCFRQTTYDDIDGPGGTIYVDILGPAGPLMYPDQISRYRLLDEMLHDRFVCGIAHPAVQKRLLTESDLTFTKAVTVTQAVELAEKGAQQIQSSVDKEVNKFSTTNAKPPGAVKNKNDSSSDKSTSIHCYIDVGRSTTNKLVNSHQKPFVLQ